MIEQDTFGACMCVWEMVTRGNGPPHDHHKPFRGVLEAQTGVTGGPHACTNRSDGKRARNGKKKEKTSKFTGVRKVVKRCKEGKQHKNSGKNSKREQEDRASNTALSHSTTKLEARKKQTETTTNCVERGTLAVKICHNKTVQN